MSRTMQIDIRLTPFYERAFKRSFPRLARLMSDYGYTRPLKVDVSLYDLVDYLSDLANSPRLAGGYKERLAPHLARMTSLKDSAREHLLARRLDDLDQTLYLLEDAFDDLEKDL